MAMQYQVIKAQDTEHGKQIRMPYTKWIDGKRYSLRISENVFSLVNPKSHFDNIQEASANGRYKVKVIRRPKAGWLFYYRLEE